MPVRRFNPCQSCCDPVPGAYFSFVTSSSIYESQFSFEGCDISCQSPDAVDPDEENPITGNILGGGMNFPFRQTQTAYASVVLCSGVRVWGWKMEIIGDEENPIFDWRVRPWTAEVETDEETGFQTVQWDTIQLDIYNIGPYVGRGSIDDLKLRPIEVDGVPQFDSYGRQRYEGGIWLESQNLGSSCATGVPDQMLLIDWRQSSCCYLPAAEIPPFGA